MIVKKTEMVYLCHGNMSNEFELNKIILEMIIIYRNDNNDKNTDIKDRNSSDARFLEYFGNFTFVENNINKYLSLLPFETAINHIKITSNNEHQRDDIEVIQKLLRQNHLSHFGSRKLSTYFVKEQYKHGYILIVWIAPNIQASCNFQLVLFFLCCGELLFNQLVSVLSNLVRLVSTVQQLSAKTLTRERCSMSQL